MSDETQYTPGPWQLDEYTGCVYGPGDDPDPIQTVGAGGPEEERANARLIAAAPDLCEALEDMYGEVMAYQPELMESEDWGPVLRSARESLTKVKGG